MRFLRSTVGPDEAEDCFQETFLAALRAYPRLPPDSNLRAWVLTIGHRKAIDSGRARARRPLPAESLPERESDDGRPERGGAPPAYDEDLWAAVRALPPKQRAALAHRFVADLSYADMATVMRCSEEAARRSVHDGLKRLRREMDR